MTTQEFTLRLIVIDNSIVLQLTNGGHPQILDDRRAKLALRFLGIYKDPITVPNRSFDLAKTTAGDQKLVTGIALQLLSTIAEYKDPIGMAGIKQLLPVKESTMSSRLSVLKGRGFVTASGIPSQYMVTGAGHAALVAALDAEPRTDSERRSKDTGNA